MLTTKRLGQCRRGFDPSVFSSEPCPCRCCGSLPERSRAHAATDATADGSVCRGVMCDGQPPSGQQRKCSHGMEWSARRADGGVRRRPRAQMQQSMSISLLPLCFCWLASVIAAAAGTGEHSPRMRAQARGDVRWSAVRPACASIGRTSILPLSKNTSSSHLLRSQFFLTLTNYI